MSFVGAVGEDAWGAMLREALVNDGVDVTALATVPDPTGTAHITVQESGENSIIVVPGANARVTTLSEEAARLIRSAAALVMQFELPQPVLLDACRLARAHGVRTILTPAPVLEPLPGLLELIDILVLNEHEATLLSGEREITEAARVLSRTSTVITTLGDRGCLLAEHGEIVAQLPAHRVDAVDSTGAGDTFVGVCVARLVAGDSLPRAIEWASLGAAISVTRSGATSSMPTWSEISDSELGGAPRTSAPGSLEGPC